MNRNLKRFLKPKPNAFKKEGPVLIIDGHNLIYRCIHIAHKHDLHDSNYTYWKYLIVNNIFQSVRMFEPKRLIIVSDSKNYWRKDVYPIYKANRKEQRIKSPIDFDKFFKVSNNFFEDIKSFFPIVFCQVDKCEGDDIIAVLTNYILNNEKIVAITTDKDMYQLLKNKNYRQYNPIKKELVQCIDPKRDLNVKILTGDRGDNIAGVIERCGPVTAGKLLDNGLDELFKDEAIKELYERNKLLIDFDMIPVNIITEIKRVYNEYPMKEYRNGKIYSFLIKHKLGNMLEDLSLYLPNVVKLS